MRPFKAIVAIVAAIIFSFEPAFVFAVVDQREPMTMRVVAVNPSAEKTHPSCFCPTCT